MVGRENASIGTVEIRCKHSGELDVFAVPCMQLLVIDFRSSAKITLLRKIR